MFNQFFTTRESEIRFVYTLLIAVIFLILIFFVLGLKVERSNISVPTKTVWHRFPTVALEAKSAYVYDARTKTVLYALNENQRLPLASITKLMSALVAQELSPSYSTITVTKEALLTEGDSGLLSDEKWSLKDLLDFSLVSSSNDGIHAVALSLGALDDLNPQAKVAQDDFVRAMNAKALELDLNNTYFWNDTGLDESEIKGGAYGTAKDMATLLEYIIYREPSIVEATRQVEVSKVSLDQHKHEAKNTNQIVSEIPGLLASKTGYTDIAGGNLVFAFDPELGRPVVISILGSTAEGRFRDAEKLIGATLEYIKSN